MYEIKSSLGEAKTCLKDTWEECYWPNVFRSVSVYGCSEEKVQQYESLQENDVGAKGRKMVLRISDQLWPTCCRFP